MSLLTALRRSFDPEMLTSLRWQYFLNIGIGVLGAAYILALGRLLGAQYFGIYTLCAAIPAVTAALLDSRLQEFALYIKENCEEREFPLIVAALYWFDLAGKIVLVGLSLAAYALLKSNGYDGIVLPYVALSAGLVFVTKCLSGPSLGVLRSFGKLEYFSIIQVSDWALRLAALVLLYFAGRVSIASVILSQIAIGGMFNLVIVRRTVAEVGLTSAAFLAGPGRLPGLLKAQGSIIFSNQAVSAMDAVVKELDVLICGAFLSTGQIGTYKIAKSLAGIAWRLADPIYIIVLPKLARLHSSGRIEELDAFTRALALALTPFAVALYGCSVVGILVLGPFVVGPEYRKAIALYPLAAAWILVALPLVWSHSLAIASGKSALQFLSGGLGNGVGLLAISVGAWRFGIEGALIGLSLAFCLPFVFSFFILRRFGVIRW